MSDNLTKTLVSDISERNPNQKPNHDMSLAPAQIKTKTEPEDLCSNLNENQRGYNASNLNEQEQMKSEQLLCVSEDRMLPVKPEMMLYLDHEVKQEMVIGPTVVEQVVSGYIHQNGSLSRQSTNVTDDMREELQCALCGLWCLSIEELKCHKQSHDTPNIPTEVTAIKDKFQINTPTQITAEGKSQSLNADLTNQIHEIPRNPLKTTIMCIKQSNTSEELQHTNNTPHNLPNRTTLIEKQHDQPEILSTTLVAAELQSPTSVNAQRHKWNESVFHCKLVLRDARELQCSHCGLFSISVSELKCHKKTHDIPKILTEIYDTHQSLTADKNNQKQTNKITNFLTKTTPMDKQQFSSAALDKPNILSKTEIKDQLQTNIIIHKILLETKEVTDDLQSVTCADKVQITHNKLLLRCTVKLQDARELKCTLCDRWCLSIRDLKRHKQTHSSNILTKNKTVNHKLQSSSGLDEAPYYSPNGKTLLDKHKNLVSRAKKNHKPYKATTKDDKKRTPVSAKNKRHKLKHKNPELQQRNPRHVSIAIKNITNQENTRELPGIANLPNSNEKKNQLPLSKNKTITCTVCFKEFKTVEQLKKHLIAHCEEMPYPCDICKKKFKTIPYLEKHMTSHRTARMIKCEACDKSFKTKYSLNVHLKIHSNEKPYVCEMCNKTFKTKKYLKLHLQSHSGVKSYFCEVCNKKIGRKDELGTHLTVHSDVKPFACNICNKMFKTKGHLRAHLNTHSGAKPFACDLCEKRYTDIKNLRIHLRTHTGERPYSCHICNKSFTANGYLTRHLQYHSRVKKFICDICSKSFVSKDFLRKHISIHSGVKPFACDICGYSYFYKSVLKVHMLIHNPNRSKLFTCDICSKTFYHRGLLRMHIQTHGSRQIPCGICSKKFKTKGDMAKHSKIHSGVKPFACSCCGKRFVIKSNFKKHLQTHEKFIFKPFSCDMCDMRFRDKCDMKKHIQIHSRVKPFACNVCDKKFKLQSYLRKHMRTTHSKDESGEICDICDKKVKYKHNIRKHVMVVHGGMKPYVCDFCSHFFSSKANLGKHLEMHSGDNAFACDICVKTAFKSQKSLRKHLYVVHKIKERD